MEEVLDEAVNQAELYSVVQIAFNFVMSFSERYNERFDAIVKAIKNAAVHDLGVIVMKTQALSGSEQKIDPAHHKAALKWALSHESVTCAIPGYINFDEMNEDFSVVYDLEYTKEEREYLDKSNVTYGMQFCLQCNECLPSCPKGVDIPTLMRTNMYASGYTNFRQARSALEEIPKENGLQNCTDCAQCTARCLNFVNIPDKIDELKLIYT